MRKGALVRLPQGPWFPWSNEFRWDRFPWQGPKRGEVRSIDDQEDLAALVEAAATTVGVVAKQAGFAFRPASSGVNRLNGPREVSVLYEAEPHDVAEQLGLSEGELTPCVDLWVSWLPDTGTLNLALPAGLRTEGPDRADRDGLVHALQIHAAHLARHLSSTHEQ